MRLPDSWKGPYWEPRDIWFGLYWTPESRERDGQTMLSFTSVYVCLLPCFPVRMRWYSYVHPDAVPGVAGRGGC